MHLTRDLAPSQNRSLQMSDEPSPNNLSDDALSGQRTNSPFHQPVRSAPARSDAAIVRARDWADLSPAERYDRTQAEGDVATNRLDPQKVTQARDRAGNLVLKDRETGKVLNADVADQPASDSPPQPTEKVRVGEFEVSEGEIRDLLAEKAERDLARAHIPAEPGAYKLDLPADFPVPDGVRIEFEDPATSASVQAAQNWAHKRGLSQAEFSELLSIYAHREVQQANWFAARQAEEFSKLGTTGPQRVDAVTRWIRAQAGDADGKVIVSNMVSAAHVRFYEKLFQKVTNPGGSTFTGLHRDPEPRGLSDEQWDGMSYGERKAYAERSSGRK